MSVAAGPRVGTAGGWLALGIVAFLVASPVAVIVTSILDPSTSMWADLWETRLPGMIVDTLTLLVTVVAGTLLLGTALA